MDPVTTTVPKEISVRMQAAQADGMVCSATIIEC